MGLFQEVTPEDFGAYMRFHYRSLGLSPRSFLGLPTRAGEIAGVQAVPFSHGLGSERTCKSMVSAGAKT